MALFICNLSTFTFYFTSGIDQVISDMSSLCGLLACIPLVGKILLCLLVYIQQGVLNGMKGWRREFLKLLETITKSGCRDLRSLDLTGYLSNNLYVVTPPSAKPTGTKSRGEEKFERVLCTPPFNGDVDDTNSFFKVLPTLFYWMDH